MTNKRQTLKLAAAAAAVALAAVLGLARPSSSASAQTALDAEEQTFVTLINNYRAQNGLGALSVDPSLQAAAEWMGADLGQNAYFDHTDSLGRDPVARICDFGYCHNTWTSENLTAAYGTAQEAFDRWAESSGHDANLLNPDFKVMGIAQVYTEGSPYGYYWVNDLGGYVAEVVATPEPTLEPTPDPTTEPTPEPTTPPSPTPAPTAVPQPAKGDVDCDGDLDAGDTLKTIQHLGGMSYSQNAGCPALGSESASGTFGDMDCDGDVDGADAVWSLEGVAGTLSTTSQVC